MNIGEVNELILQEIMSLARKGIDSSAIYLGRKTFNTLRLEVEPYQIYLGAPSNDRPKFHGLEIYVVDADEHIKVC